LIVLDTSAALAALAGRPINDALLSRLREDGDLHAPHLIDVEMVHALRRLVASRALTMDRASDVRSDFADLEIVRYPHHPLADRMWELRHNLSAYEACFVSLAEALDVPLITTDAHLARIRGHQARIELFRAG
jgi:predicted nucleic acid-binding protein